MTFDVQRMQRGGPAIAFDRGLGLASASCHGMAWVRRSNGSKRAPARLPRAHGL